MPEKKSEEVEEGKTGLWEGERANASSHFKERRRDPETKKRRPTRDDEKSRKKTVRLIRKLKNRVIGKTKVCTKSATELKNTYKLHLAGTINGQRDGAFLGKANKGKKKERSFFWGKETKSCLTEF